MIGESSQDKKETMMKTKILSFARAIRRFSEHPVTRMIVGMVLLLTAIYEIEEGLLIELKNEGAKSHHGIAAFGVLTMIAAIPDMLEGLAAGTAYVEHLHDTENTVEDA